MECSHRRPIHETRLAVPRRLLAITGDGSAPPGDQFTMRWFLDHAVVDALLDDPQSPLERDAAIFDLKMLLMARGSREAAGRGSGDTPAAQMQGGPRGAGLSTRGLEPLPQHNLGPRSRMDGREVCIERTDSDGSQFSAPGPRTRNSCSHLCALLPVTRRPPCSTCTARGGRPPTTELGAGSGHTRPSSPGRGVCRGSGGGRGHSGGTRPRHVRDMPGALGPGWRGTWPRRAPGRTTAKSCWGASAPGSAATSSSTSLSGSWRGAPSTRRADSSPPPEIAPQITRDRTRSHEIARDRTRSQQAHTGFTGWHLKPTKTVLLLRLKSRRRSALPS